MVVRLHGVRPRSSVLAATPCKRTHLGYSHQKHCPHCQHAASVDYSSTHTPIYAPFILADPLTPTLDRRSLPLLGLAGVVVVWGAGPVVTKLITTHPMIGTCVRFALSIPVLYAIVHLRGGRVSRTVFRTAMLPGIAFGVNLIFVFAAVQRVAVAVLAVAVALQPAILLVVAGPLLGERPTRRQIAWTLLGVIATGGVILGAGEELRATPLGLVLAIAALLTFSTYFALTRIARSTTDVDPFEWMAAINVWSLLAAAGPALIVVRGDDLAEVSWEDLWWLVVLAYLTGVAGHVLMSWVHGYIEASRSSLYLLGMNVVAVALAWPVHDEPVTLVQVLFGIVVLIAVAAVIRIPPETTTAVTTEERPN